MNKNGKPPDCGFPFLYSIYWIFFIVAFVLFCVVPSVASGVVFSSAGRCVSGSFVFSSVAGSVSSCVLLSPESSVFPNFQCCPVFVSAVLLCCSLLMPASFLSSVLPFDVLSSVPSVPVFLTVLSVSVRTAAPVCLQLLFLSVLPWLTYCDSPIPAVSFFRLLTVPQQR